MTFGTAIRYAETLLNGRVAYWLRNAHELVCSLSSSLAEDELISSNSLVDLGVGSDPRIYSFLSHAYHVYVFAHELLAY
jgi:hypothetical protein